MLDFLFLDMGMLYRGIEEKALVKEEGEESRCSLFSLAPALAYVFNIYSIIERRCSMAEYPLGPECPFCIHWDGQQCLTPWAIFFEAVSCFEPLEEDEDEDAGQPWEGWPVPAAHHRGPQEY